MEIQFLGFRTGLSLKGSPGFTDGYFKIDTSSAAVNPLTKEEYPNVNGLVIKLPDLRGDENIEEKLWQAWERAEEVMISIASKCRTCAFVDRPIHCTALGKVYFLREGVWEEKSSFEKIHIIGGGSFCDDAISLAEPVGDLDSFYWAARDESLPVDYRALQAWRFLEGWFGVKDRVLCKKLLSLDSFKVFSGHQKDTGKPVWREEKVTQLFVDHYYENIRCAISHGGAARPGESSRVVYPTSKFLELDIDWNLREVLELIDWIVGENIK